METENSQDDEHFSNNINQKFEQLTKEVEKLKADKRQKLFQFEQLETLLKKSQSETKEYKKKLEDALSKLETLSQTTALLTEQTNKASTEDASLSSLQALVNQRELELHQANLTIAELQKNLVETKKVSNDDEASALKTIVSQLQAELEHVRTENSSQLEIVNEQLNQKSKENEQLTNKLKALAIKYSKDKEQWEQNAISKFAEERAKLTTEMEHLVQQVEQLKHTLGKAADTKNILEQQVAQSFNEQTSTREQMERMQAEIASLTERMHLLAESYRIKCEQEEELKRANQSSLEEIAALNEKLDCTRTGLEQQLTQAKDKLDETSVQYAYLQTQLKEITESANTKAYELATTQQRLEEQTRQIASAEQALAVKEQELEELHEIHANAMNEQIGENETLKEEARKQTTCQQELQSTITSLQQEIVALQEKLHCAEASLTSTKEQTTSEIVNQQASIADLEKIVASLEDRLKQAEARANSLEEFKAELTFTYNEKVAELERSNQLREEDNEQFTTEAKCKDEAIRLLNKQLEELQAELASNREQIAFLQDEANAESGELTEVREMLKHTQEALQLSQEAKECIERKLADAQVEENAQHFEYARLEEEIIQYTEQLQALQQDLKLKSEVIAMLEESKHQSSVTISNLESKHSEMCSVVDDEHLKLVAAEEQLAETRDRLQTMATVVAEQSQKVNHVVDELETNQQEKHELSEQLQNEIQEHLNTKRDMEMQAAFIQQQKSHIATLEEQLDPLRAEIASKQEDIVILQRKLVDQETTIARLADTCKDQNANVDSLKDTKSELLDTIEKLKQSEQFLMLEKVRLSAEVDDSNAANKLIKAEVCQLQENFDATKDVMDNYTTKEDQLKASLSSLQLECDRLQSSLQEKEEEAKMVESQLDNSGQQLMELRRQLADTEREKRSAEVQLVTMKGTIEQLEKATSEMNTELVQAAQDLVNTKESYEQKLRDSVFSINVLKTQVEKLQQSLTSTKNDTYESARRELTEQFEQEKSVMQENHARLLEEVQKQAQQVKEQHASSLKATESALTEVTVEMTTLKAVHEKEALHRNELMNQLTEEKKCVECQRDELRQQLEQAVQTTQVLRNATAQVEEQLVASQTDNDALRAEMTSLRALITADTEMKQSLNKSLLQEQANCKALADQLAQLRTEAQCATSKKEEEAKSSIESIQQSLVAKQLEADQWAIKYDNLIQENRKMRKKIGVLEAKIAATAKKSEASNKSIKPVVSSAVPKTGVAPTTVLPPNVQVKRTNAEATADSKASSTPSSPVIKKLRAENTTMGTQPAKPAITSAVAPRMSTTPLQERSGNSVPSIDPSPASKIAPRTQQHQPKRVVSKEAIANKPSSEEESCNVQ